MTQLASALRAAPQVTTKRGALFPRLHRLLALRAQRRALLSLSEEQLRDIGVSAQDAAAEAAKPIWDTPAHW